MCLRGGEVSHGYRGQRNQSRPAAQGMKQLGKQASTALSDFDKRTYPVRMRDPNLLPARSHFHVQGIRKEVERGGDTGGGCWFPQGQPPVLYSSTLSPLLGHSGSPFPYRAGANGAWGSKLPPVLSHASMCWPHSLSSSPSHPPSPLRSYPPGTGHHDRSSSRTKRRTLRRRSCRCPWQAAR